MIMFWSIAAGMIVLALLFVVPPMLRPAKRSSVSTDALNAEVIKSQLSELKADLDAGKLDATQYDSARGDLERELLYDISDSNTTTKSHGRRSGRWAIVIPVVAIPLCAVFLYQKIGAGELIAMKDATGSQMPVSREAARHSLGELVIQLEARLEKEPDSAQGWLLLARSYTAMKRFGDAASAYEQVYRLGGSSQPQILADYADVIAMSNGGQFNDKAGTLLERALELDPNDIKTLWLAGHWKYDKGDYPAAIDFWQRTAALLPPDGEDMAVIQKQIEIAQKELGIPAGTTAMAKPAASPNQQKATVNPALRVKVELDPALQASVSPGDTLFVYARAVSGPRMPLAIVRKQAGDLPVTVELDDSMAMSPAMVLSNFDEVTVEARISKSGNAMTQSGDLKGSHSPVKTGENDPVRIVINNAIP